MKSIRSDLSAKETAVLEIFDSAIIKILSLHAEVTTELNEKRTLKEKLSFLLAKRSEAQKQILAIRPIILAFFEGDKAQAQKYLGTFDEVLTGIDEHISSLRTELPIGLGASLTSLDDDRIRQLFRDALEEVNRATQQRDDLLRRSDVAKELKISLKTVSSWMKSGKLPYHRINSRIFFKRSEIIESMQLPLKYKRK